MSRHILYISYDGLVEPLGQSQVLPYVRQLHARGDTMTVLSFEKPADRQSGAVERLRADLGRAGIGWVPLAYHKRPRLPATAYDLALGYVRAAMLVRRHGIRIVHARSYIAGLIAWRLKRTLGTRFLFDIRGFWADERVEGGLWAPGSRVYRAVKRLEPRLLRDADAIVTLTERSRSTLEAWLAGAPVPITVIPTCVDLARFRIQRNGPRQERPPVFVYSGSLGTVYQFDEMVRFMEAATRRFAGARFMVLTREIDEARRVLAGARLASDSVTVATVSPHEVPVRLTNADAAICFCKPGLGREASCPTKIGEYLAVGLPIITNSAIGDMQAVVGANDVGAVVDAFTASAYDDALRRLETLWADTTLAVRCRRVAEQYFMLETGIARFQAVYGSLAPAGVIDSHHTKVSA